MKQQNQHSDLLINAGFSLLLTAHSVRFFLNCPNSYVAIEKCGFMYCMQGVHSIVQMPCFLFSAISEHSGVEGCDESEYASGTYPQRIKDNLCDMTDIGLVDSKYSMSKFCIFCFLLNL